MSFNINFGQGFGQAFDGLFQQALGFNSQAQQAHVQAPPGRHYTNTSYTGSSGTSSSSSFSTGTGGYTQTTDVHGNVTTTYWGDMQGQQQQQQQPAQPAPAPQPHVAAPVLTRARARHVAAAPAPAPVVPDHKAAQAQARARQQAQLEAQQKARKAEAKPIPPPSSPMKGRSPAKVGTRGAASMYSEPIVIEDSDDEDVKPIVKRVKVELADQHSTIQVKSDKPRIKTESR